MKKLLTVSAGFILLQVSAPSIMADELSPILDPKEYRQTLPGMPPPEKVSAVGTLIGYIQTDEGEPLSGGKVFFFNEATGPLPAPEKYWRVPDRIGSLDENGGFSVELPPGRYYIGAIQKKGDTSLSGSPQVGDIYYSAENVYEVLPAIKNNLEIIRGAKLFFGIDANNEAVTAIEGVVFDSSGKPVADVVVFAHIKSALNDGPVFVSGRTDINGVYRLRVAGAGTFYLRVSNVYGRKGVESGSVADIYGGNKSIAVTVKDREVIRGINILGIESGTSRLKSDDRSNK